MAEEDKTFDVYDEKGTKVVEGKPSPVQIDGLEPNTTYSGWKLAYAGEDDMSVIPDFTTLPLALSSFTIDSTNLSGVVGGSTVLTASNFTPANATDKSLNATIEDSSVATLVDNKDNTYTVNFVKAGTTKIHWVANDGSGAKADATVTVIEHTPEQATEQATEPAAG